MCQSIYLKIYFYFWNNFLKSSVTYTKYPLVLLKYYAIRSKIALVGTCLKLGKLNLDGLLLAGAKHTKSPLSVQVSKTFFHQKRRKEKSRHSTENFTSSLAHKKSLICVASIIIYLYTSKSKQKTYYSR